MKNLKANTVEMFSKKVVINRYRSEFDHLPYKSICKIKLNNIIFNVYFFQGRMGKGNIDELATRFCVGSSAEANQTYRQVNYKDLRLKLQQEKLKLQLDRQHLKKFNGIKTRYGTTSAFNQHKEVWLKEDISIKSQIRSLSAIISEQADPAKLLCENEICEFLNILQDEFKLFETKTIQPVWEFVEDMQHWLTSADKCNKDEIGSVYSSMADQQNHIMNILCEQSKSLEEDLNLFNNVLKSWEFQAENVTESLLRLRFPHNETICEYIEEYLLVDKKYNDALVDLRNYYSIALDMGKNGGWVTEEHVLFRHISGQYPVDKFQRSQLCLEMLKLILPHKTEQELKEHNEWIQLHEMYSEHRKTIKRMHRAALKKLVAGAEADCKQQWVLFRQMQEKTDEILSQKEKTAKLFEELLKCRALKLAKIKAEEEELLEVQYKMTKERAGFEKKQAKQRMVEKDRIQAFKDMKEVKELEYQRKMEELQEKDAARKKNRLTVGKKRVEYRQDLHEKKKTEQATAAVQRLQMEQNKKEQLEKLAATVAVEAKIDPTRIFKDTEASASKLKATDYVDNYQLFKMFGYEDCAIQSDMRFKVEKALRNAGLVDTDYGRQIMKGIRPPIEPRKDMESTVFKKDDK